MIDTVAFMKIITIKDIAREAGVAPSTVSAVLNGKSKEMRISTGLSKQIRELAAVMGYHPNHTAVSLRTGKTKVLGLIVEDISNIFFAALAKTIEDEADTIGFKVLYCSTENDEQKAKERIRMLTQHQVEGILLTPTHGMQEEVIRLAEKNKPIVLMDRYFPGIDIPYVVVDNYEGAKMGVQHLIAKGRKRVAFVTVKLGQVQMELRKQAWEETMALHGQTDTGKLLLEMPYHNRPEAAISSIMEFLQANPGIDAVFFATNYLGVYGLEALKNLQLNIPGDLGVICFDDHDIFRLYPPGITIIRQPVQEIAKVAMQLLMEQFGTVHKSSCAGSQRKLEPELIVRGSS